MVVRTTRSRLLTVQVTTLVTTPVMASNFLEAVLHCSCHDYIMASASNVFKVSSFYIILFILPRISRSWISRSYFSPWCLSASRPTLGPLASLLLKMFLTPIFLTSKHNDPILTCVNQPHILDLRTKFQLFSASSEVRVASKSFIVSLTLLHHHHVFC